MQIPNGLLSGRSLSLLQLFVFYPRIPQLILKVQCQISCCATKHVLWWASLALGLVSSYAGSPCLQAPSVFCRSGKSHGVLLGALHTPCLPALPYHVPGTETLQHIQVWSSCLPGDLRGLWSPALYAHARPWGSGQEAEHHSLPGWIKGSPVLRSWSWW